MVSEQKMPYWKRLASGRLLRVAVGYPVVVWVVLQVAEVVVPELPLPEWTLRLLILIVLLGYPVALFLAWAAGRDHPAQDAAAAAPPARGTIAVLPFADMTSESDQAYFCEGMAEEIINDLVKVASLKVASRTSSFSFRNTDLDTARIGQALNVASILEGSVRKSGNNLRVTAQLIDVASGYHLWSERYDCELDDIFTVQDEIARSIVGALKVTITPEEERAIRMPVTCTPQAYTYYLKGRHQFHKFGRRGLDSARTWFALSLEQCDSYAPSQAGMADCLSHIYQYLDARDEHRVQAREYADRAVALDPQSAEAHAACGLARAISNDTEAAEADYRRALELDPDLFEAHYYYGRLLWTARRKEEAVEQFKLAVDLKPDDYQLAGLLTSMLRGMDMQRDLRRYAQLSIDRSEAHLLNEPDDVRAMYLMAGSLLVFGRDEEARVLCERAVALQPSTDTYYNVACTYTIMGEVGRALDMLEAADLRGNNYEWMINDPDLAPLRGEPRFQAILDALPHGDQAS